MTLDRSSKIMVTGANCHVGFNVLKMLKKMGYTNLRATVRDANSTVKTTASKALGIMTMSRWIFWRPTHRPRSMRASMSCSMSQQLGEFTPMGSMRMGAIGIYFPVTGVRDVAHARILAAEQSDWIAAYGVPGLHVYTWRGANPCKQCQG